MPKARNRAPICRCICVAGLAISCYGQTPTALQYHDVPGTAAVYSNGYLVTWDSPAYSEMTLYRRDAEIAYSVAQNRDGVSYKGWAVDSDGVAAGVYGTVEPWEGRIDIFDASGQLTGTINTGSYLPQSLAFAPDHTLWTVGFNAGNDGSRGDFNVLHHYERSGKELGSAVPWSRIESEHNSYTTLQGIIGARRLFAAKDRLGFSCWTRYGHHTWIEVSFSGNVLGQYDLGGYEEGSYFPVAMTESGAVYAQAYDAGHFQGWSVLDRSESAWRKLAGFPKGRIIGSEADDLVFARQDGGLKTVIFVPSKSLALSAKDEERAALTKP